MNGPVSIIINKDIEWSDILALSMSDPTVYACIACAHQNGFSREKTLMIVVSVLVEQNKRLSDAITRVYERTGVLHTKIRTDET